MLLARGGGVPLLYETRGTTFWSTSGRGCSSAAETTSTRSWSRHNEHLSLIPVAIDKLLFAKPGSTTTPLAGGADDGAHLGLAALLFVYAKRRVGGMLALCAAALLLFLGPGWQNIVSLFQVAWLISLGGRRRDPSGARPRRRCGERRRAASSRVALASSGLGVAIVIALVVELAGGGGAGATCGSLAIPIRAVRDLVAGHRPAGYRARQLSTRRSTSRSDGRGRRPQRARGTGRLPGFP